LVDDRVDVSLEVVVLADGIRLKYLAHHGFLEKLAVEDLSAVGNEVLVEINRV
jgi:hypothetical protein